MSNFSDIRIIQVTFQWDDHVRVVLDQQLIFTCRPTRTHYPVSEPTSLCFCVLCAWRRSSKYQFHSLWFDLTTARTPDIPHSHANLYTLDAVLNFFSKIDNGWKKHSICIIRYIYNRNLLWRFWLQQKRFLICEKNIYICILKKYGIFINDCPYHNLAYLLLVFFLNYSNV